MPSSSDYMGATSLRPVRLFQGFLPGAETILYTVPTDGSVGFVVVKNIRLTNGQSTASQPVIGIVPNGYTIALTGFPTGGTFTPTVTPPGGSLTTLAAQPYNVAPLTLQAAIAAVVGAGKVQVFGVAQTSGTGGSGNYIITFTGTALGTTIGIGSTAFTGGTSPAVTATASAPGNKAFHILDTLGVGVAAFDAIDDAPNQILLPGDSLSGFQYPVPTRLTATIWGLVAA